MFLCISAHIQLENQATFKLAEPCETCIPQNYKGETAGTFLSPRKQDKA